MILQLKDIDLNNTLVVVVTILIVAIVSFARYILFSGAYHYFFFKLFKNTFKNRSLRKKPIKKKQAFKEIYWSSFSGLIFGVFMVFCYFLWKIDATKIYSNSATYSLWYIPLSIVLFLFLQDTYYYWIHRAMHHPKIYRYVHLIHHKSVHTSVWTSFSFHPLETILQAIFLPIVICILPMHYYAIIAVLTIMTISATINHAGVELYPSGKYGKWFQHIFIGATHHDSHHTKFNYNYGLYFTFWDRIMGTEYETSKQ
ncbi:sterol desaturase family protein [Polaribacter sp.]|nr:sterol desaturase family protein [Polaribacter sp.]